MPSNEELYDEADRLKEEGRLDDAVAKLNELLAQDTNYSLAHAALAVLLGRLDRHEEAIESAKKVCELEPEDPFSHTQLSVIYQRASVARRNDEYVRLAEEAMARSRTIQGGF